MSSSQQQPLVSDDSRWPVNCCPSASPSLTSSNSFAMDSLASSQSSTTDQMDEPKRSYSACALSLPDSEFMLGFLERKPYRPFRSNEEYLVAMKEDLAEWLNTLYTEVDLSADNFINRLETGVVLCRHANSVLRKAREWRMQNGYSPFKQLSLSDFDLDRDVPFKMNALPGTFLARDNVANFIDWCRRIRIHECLLFETEDLVARKNEKSFVLCLLEVARYGAKFGLLAPTLVQFEQEIDQELEKEQQQAKHSNGLQAPSVTGSLSLDQGIFQDFTPQQQITNNDLESLHEKVVNLLSRCTCPVQFYLEHLSEGKYRIGDTKTLIFVRILRNHVMVRVGGGWDTLEHYLEKHDPCRCRFGHRYSSSARVSLSNAQVKSPQMQVTYERPDQSNSQPRRSMVSVNSSPSSVRRPIRPNSVTTNLHSGHDLSSVRRASTSSNDSASSTCSTPLTTSHSEKCDSLVSSEHSSLSSNHSLGSYTVPVLPDRNNNIKGLSNQSPAKPQALPQSKPCSNKKRVLPTPDNSSRIPKSKGSAVQLKSSFTAFPSASKALSNAHKVKSTSSLAIPQLSSSKIPCLDSTNKPRLNVSSRYSTNNIYLAVSQEHDKEKPNKRLSLTPAVPAKQRSRVPNLSRNKQKSSLELNLNLSNENFYSLSQIGKTLEQVPNKPQKAAHQQHRRHHSSSSLPRVTKSAHNSPYSKRRELANGINSNCPSTGPNPVSDNSRHNKIGSKLDSAKRFQGSATSLNSTASTASGSTNSSSSSLNTTVATTGDNMHSQGPRQLSKTMVTGGGPFLEPKKSFISADKKTPSSALVEVCSWLERNHLAST